MTFNKNELFILVPIFFGVMLGIIEALGIVMFQKSSMADHSVQLILYPIAILGILFPVAYIIGIIISIAPFLNQEITVVP